MKKILLLSLLCSTHTFFLNAQMPALACETAELEADVGNLMEKFLPSYRDTLLGYIFAVLVQKNKVDLDAIPGFSRFVPGLIKHQIINFLERTEFNKPEHMDLHQKYEYRHQNPPLAELNFDLETLLNKLEFVNFNTLKILYARYYPYIFKDRVRAAGFEPYLLPDPMYLGEPAIAEKGHVMAREKHKRKKDKDAEQHDQERHDREKERHRAAEPQVKKETSVPTAPKKEPSVGKEFKSPQEFADYYKDKSDHEVLGVFATASEQEINKAFRKLSAKWHPDRWNDEVQRIQQRVNEARRKGDRATEDKATAESEAAAAKVKVAYELIEKAKLDMLARRAKD